LEDRRPKTGDGGWKTGDGLAPSAVHPVQILTERFDRVKTPEEAEKKNVEY
jgi:hypothetical protein